MATIERLVEIWAEEERKNLAMTEQERVRIWNMIEMRLDEVIPQPTVTSINTDRYWIRWMRWSMVPAMAAVFMMMAVMQEGNGNMGALESLPSETVSMNTTLEPSSMIDTVATQPVAEVKAVTPRVSTIRAPSRRSAAPRIVAARGQSVFVAWGSSVYGPGGNVVTADQTTNQNPWASSVFSD